MPNALCNASLQEAHEALYELELEALAAQHIVDEGIDVAAAGSDAPDEAQPESAVLEVEDMQQVPAHASVHLSEMLPWRACSKGSRALTM